MILLSDANILIDLGYVNGLEVLTKIGATEVLDVVLDECEDERQPNLVRDVLDTGVTRIETRMSWMREARRYRRADLSSNDSLNLYYAKTFKRILLAGDKPLRERCSKEGVTVHGSLWIVRQAAEQNLITRQELCFWLNKWPQIGRRLPAKEIAELKIILGCDS